MGRVMSIVVFVLSALGAVAGWYRGKKEINKMAIEQTSIIGAVMFGVGVKALMNYELAYTWWKAVIFGLVVIVMVVVFYGWQMKTWTKEGKSWCVHKHSGFPEGEVQVEVELDIN